MPIAIFFSSADYIPRYLVRSELNPGIRKESLAAPPFKDFVEVRFGKALPISQSDQRNRITFS
jgi:hypothetical protein